MIWMRCIQNLKGWKTCLKQCLNVSKMHVWFYLPYPDNTFQPLWIHRDDFYFLFETDSFDLMLGGLFPYKTDKFCKQVSEFLPEGFMQIKHDKMY